MKYTMIAAVLALSAGTALADEQRQPSAETAASKAFVADLGLHVVNVGVGLQDGSREIQITGGLYGAWTQTDNVFGLSGSARGINATGGNIRGRYLHYVNGKRRSGMWVSGFGQAGLARSAKDGSYNLAVIGAVGASAGYGFSLGRWIIAVGAGAQLHGASGQRGFFRPYPTIDAIISYRL